MIWLNAFIFVLLSAGHAGLQVALLNRLYALRISGRCMDLLGGVHYLLLFGVPVLLVWLAGFRGPELLNGGAWRDVMPAWWVVFVACGVGLVGLLTSTARWRLQRDPVELESSESSIINIADLLGHRPIGDGHYRRSVRLPGNEVFQLDVATKTVRHPRLPAAWDGLSILHISDLHFEGTIDVAYFREAIRLGRECNPHLVVFTGDLLDREDLIRWLPETLGTIDAPLGRFFVLGNHDWYLQPDQLRRTLGELGWVDASQSVTHIAGERIAGLQTSGMSRGESAHGLVIAGDERPWMGDEPDFGPTRDGEFRLLLSHSPDSLPWAKQHGVDLMLAGHNHGGQIVLPVIGPVYSPSRFGVKYAAGTFWEEPTLLHVSRGVGAKQPVRFNCRPELTLLVVRGVE